MRAVPGDPNAIFFPKLRVLIVRIAPNSCVFYPLLQSLGAWLTDFRLGHHQLQAQQIQIGQTYQPVYLGGVLLLAQVMGLAKAELAFDGHE